MLTFTVPISRGHAAVRGVLAATLGIACLVWPNVTIGVAVALFAIYCFADAITQMVWLFTASHTSSQRVLMVLLVLFDVAAGVVAVADPGMTAGVLVVLIGVWAIVVGAAELAATWSIRGSDSGWLTVGGLLSIVLGALLIIWPGIGAVTLAIVFGAYLVAFGITMLTAAATTPRGREVSVVGAR
jgi:uncharacterized membrane protein HdeD (DUF308 family)